MNIRGRTLPCAVGLLLTLAAAAPVLAAPAQAPTTDAAAAAGASDVRRQAWPQRASQVLGKPVRGAEGEPIGRLTDLFVNSLTARTRYAVIVSDTELPGAAQTYAVPVDDLRPDGAALKTAAMSRQRLLHSGAKDSDWKSALLGRRIDDIDAYFGYQAPPSPGRSLLASELLGTRVQGQGGESLGRITDLVIDLGEGRVLYAVMAGQPALATAQGTLLAFPLQAFEETGSGEMRLRLQPAALAAARRFDAARWNEGSQAVGEVPVNPVPQ